MLSKKMHFLYKKVTTFLTTYYAHTLEYRAEILLWALSGSLPLILMGVWIQAAQSGNFALNSIEFARYFFAVFLVRQFTVVWVIWDFEREVMEGKLSFHLLQPVDPVWHHVSRHLAEKFTRFPFTLGFILLFFLLYPQSIWMPSLKNLFLSIIALILAFVLRFTIQYTFAMLAFWTERATAIENFWFLFYIFLSGIIAPLTVFPSAVREFLLWTPFPYLIYFPAGLLVGLPLQIIKGFLVIIAWTIIFLLLNRWLWRKGLKHYSGMGA
jgi:ABC-2 type transport system permease protein